jgi:hypothetical protein
VNISHGIKWHYLKDLIDGVRTKEAALVFVVTEREFEHYRGQRYQLKTREGYCRQPIPAEYSVKQFVMLLTVTHVKMLVEDLPDLSTLLQAKADLSCLMVPLHH